MNSTEQKARHTVVTQTRDELLKKLDEQGELLMVVIETETKVRQELMLEETTARRYANDALVARINQETTNRLELANEQRYYVDLEDRVTRDRVKSVNSRLETLLNLTTWGRIKWVMWGVIAPPVVKQQ